MTYRLLDWLACPRNSCFPLKITAAIERQLPACSAGRSPIRCDAYCGRRQAPVDDIPAEECLACATVEVVEGEIRCECCGAISTLTDGIPDMLPPELAAAARLGAAASAPRGLRDKASEMAARDQQAASYNSRRNPFDREAELGVLLRSLDVRPRDRILDGGAGTGFVTLACVARNVELAAVDFSRESLKMLRSAIPLPLLSQTHLVQADLTRLPFRDGIFDKAVQAQVLEHLPTAEDRDAAVSETKRVLTRGGRFVLSAYNFSLWKKRSAARGEVHFAQREGYHGGRIYYRNFEAAELRALLSQHFQVRSIRGVINELPEDLQYRLRPFGLLVERGLQMTALSVHLGRLLVASCRREGQPPTPNQGSSSPRPAA